MQHVNLLLSEWVRRRAYASYYAIEGFHVTSYQANFASHPSRDRHVGFLLHGRV